MTRQAISVAPDTADAVKRFAKTHDIAISDVFERGAWFYMLFAANAEGVTLTPRERDVLRVLTQAEKPLGRSAIGVGSAMTRHRAIGKFRRLGYVATMASGDITITALGRATLKAWDERQHAQVWANPGAPPPDGE